MVLSSCGEVHCGSGITTFTLFLQLPCTTMYSNTHRCTTVYDDVGMFLLRCCAEARAREGHAYENKTGGRHTSSTVRGVIETAHCFLRAFLVDMVNSHPAPEPISGEVEVSVRTMNYIQQTSHIIVSTSIGGSTAACSRRALSSNLSRHTIGKACVGSGT